METLVLSRGDVTVGLVPERGAIVTSIAVGDKELLYLDRATLDDPAKNVRGGIPVLFPYAGKLQGGRLIEAGTAMGQHGFGRSRPWAVVEKSAGEARLRLVQDDATRASFPYDYDADYRVSLLPRGAEVRLRVDGRGARPVPLSPGWHPYFRCPAAEKVRVSGDLRGLSSDKLGDDREFDFGLEPPPGGNTRFVLPDLGAIRISFSPEMRHMQFWSQPGKDFICIEPFFGPPGTINTDQRMTVPARGSRELWVRIERDD
jgi:galactose mutarotase-like enzyme